MNPRDPEGTTEGELVGDDGGNVPQSLRDDAPGLAVYRDLRDVIATRGRYHPLDPSNLVKHGALLATPLVLRYSAGVIDIDAKAACAARALTDAVRAIKFEGPHAEATQDAARAAFGVDDPYLGQPKLNVRLDDWARRNGLTDSVSSFKNTYRERVLLAIIDYLQHPPSGIAYSPGVPVETKIFELWTVVTALLYASVGTAAAYIVLREEHAYPGGPLPLDYKPNLDAPMNERFPLDAELSMSLKICYIRFTVLILHCFVMEAPGNDVLRVAGWLETHLPERCRFWLDNSLEAIVNVRGYNSTELARLNLYGDPQWHWMARDSELLEAFDPEWESWLTSKLIATEQLHNVLGWFSAHASQASRLLAAAMQTNAAWLISDTPAVGVAGVRAIHVACHGEVTARELTLTLFDALSRGASDSVLGLPSFETPHKL